MPFETPMSDILPPYWLPDRHSQTIVPALMGRRLIASTGLVRQRWATPDGDFIDVDRNQTSLSDVDRPLLVLFHGLEGSAGSHYARAFSAWASGLGLGYAIPHFRGCSGELNAGPRAYHSGDHGEVDWILRRLKMESSSRSLMAVGVSLGGNALAHWVGLQAETAGTVVDAAAAVSAPLDLTASGHAMQRGFNRHVYGRLFLNTMLPKARQKARQYPGLFSVDALAEVRTLYDFDNVFTAPVHGFGSTEHYWRKASAKPLLHNVRLPLLLLNAQNDPFVPRQSLPGPRDVSRVVSLWQPKAGGHVGFPGRWMRSRPVGSWLMGMPEHVGRWLLRHVSPGSI